VLTRQYVHSYAAAVKRDCEAELADESNELRVTIVELQAELSKTVSERDQLKTAPHRSSSSPSNAALPRPSAVTIKAMRSALGVDKERHLQILVRPATLPLFSTNLRRDLQSFMRTAVHQCHLDERLHWWDQDIERMKAAFALVRGCHSAGRAPLTGYLDS
jgi:hypothetical protein